MRTDWQQAEYTVGYGLRHRGVRCKNVGHLKLAWDVITQHGVKIDVKFSAMKNRRWVVNLRRRGAKKHGKPDFFVVVLSGFVGPSGKGPKRNVIFVVLDGRKYPKQSMLIWTLRSLVMRHSREIDAWGKILRVERRRAARRRKLEAA